MPARRAGICAFPCLPTTTSTEETTLSTTHEIQHEQHHLDHLYEVVDTQRDQTHAHLRQELLNNSRSMQAALDRAGTTKSLVGRLRQFGGRLQNLCFGKLVETETHEPLYIGRCGVADDNYDQLLIDWRAPIAEAFYRATGVDPMGMELRRHLITDGRTLLAIEDDLLTPDSIDEDGAEALVGEAALLASLNRERTGHMGDIVATIQRDQDHIIRAPMKGTLLVGGGPGTGKTVVALHRAAYLLFTHRAQIENNGVLVMGPSKLFTNYIERVLPSLGESLVLMKSWANLLPGLTARPDPDRAAAELKGSLVMVDVLRRAVRAMERVPSAPLPYTGTDGIRRLLSPSDIRRLVNATRATGKPHNEARRAFEQKLFKFVGLSKHTPPEFRELCLRSLVSVAERTWPITDSRNLLNRLLSDEAFLQFAARGVLVGDSWRTLLRGEWEPWTISDLPLLDELDEMLGSEPKLVRAMCEGGQTYALETAGRLVRDLASTYGGDYEGDYGGGASGSANLSGIVTAAMLAERFEERPEMPALIEQARADASWKFAHIVVDEAQDVSPMQWRALARRSIGRSMTIVGDPDQQAYPMEGSWVDRIKGGLGVESIDERSLHINYRTPAHLVAPAAQLRALAGATDETHDTRYVRSGSSPWATMCDALDTDAVRTAIDRARAELGDRGRLAVISSSGAVELVARALQSDGAERAPRGAARLTCPVAGYTADEVKGLEFDSVLVVDPKAIEAECGWRQLYVVLTRPTRHLGMVIAGEPSELEASWLAEGAALRPTS
ncbi:MAG: hypothetical protein RI900_573 [Actinomycetota bacterium]